jgi:two-component system, NtrC family, sensor kinase
LTAVIGYGELLGEEASIASARAQSGKLLGEARRMQRIVENLLRFSRQGPKLRRVVNIAPVVHEALALHEYYRRPPDLETLVDIQPGMRPVLVDEDQLKQILLNLLNNAVDAVESGKKRNRITLRVFERDCKAIIQLDDTGPGFSNVNRAFDPFYTTKPLGKGTGLGLSICYGIVKEHGGDIRVENLSEGARVTVELPLANKSESVPVEEPFPPVYSSTSNAARPTTTSAAGYANVRILQSSRTEPDDTL